MMMSTYNRANLGATALSDQCPSLEQLQGIVDPSDPCQAGGTITTNVQTPCPSGSTCSIIAGVPNTGIYALGGILLMFMFVSVAK